MTKLIEKKELMKEIKYQMKATKKRIRCQLKDLQKTFKISGYLGDDTCSDLIYWTGYFDCLEELEERIKEGDFD